MYRVFLLAIHIFFLPGFCVSGYGQVALSSVLADFQLIREGSDRYIDLEIISRSDKREFIFRIDAPNTYAVIYSNKTLENGEKEHIRIKFNPKIVGYFEHSLLLHVSSSDAPITIKTKGYVEQLPKELDPDCPSFANKNVIQESGFQLSVEVIDLQTKLPIPGAEVKLLSNGQAATELIVDENGLAKEMIPLGLYYFVFSAEGYMGEEFPSYVNNNNNYVLAELNQNAPKDTDTTIFKDEVTNVVESDSVSEIGIPILNSDNTTLTSDPPEFSTARFAPNNLVFCIDISASMKYTGKLDLLKVSMIELTSMLRQVDNVAIVTYASEADVLMETTSAADKDKILERIELLEANGFTAGIEGMRLAYSKAIEAFISNGNNQVIMVTDGGFNRGKGSSKRLARKYARKQIKMSVVGIKNTAFYERSMRDVARSGEGNFVGINTYQDARSALKTEIKNQSVLSPE